MPCFDYSAAGWYFVTVCTHDRNELFGEIRDGRMVLNDAGECVRQTWNELSNNTTASGWMNMSSCPTIFMESSL
jgi:REP element-mobilizing transposase RayT